MTCPLHMSGFPVAGGLPGYICQPQQEAHPQGLQAMFEDAWWQGIKLLWNFAERCLGLLGAAVHEHAGNKQHARLCGP